MKVWFPLLFIALFCGAIACKKKNANSPIPVISFVSLQPDSVRAGSSQDTAFLRFNFSDADGDLGNDPTAGNYDVFLRDSRDSAISRYLFPPIPDDARDPVEGLNGQGVIALLASKIIPRQDTLHKKHGDTLTYEMWVKDQAQHTSDTITTTPLRVKIP